MVYHGLEIQIIMMIKERKKLSKQMRDVEDEEDDEMLLRFRTKGGHIHRIKIGS